MIDEQAEQSTPAPRQWNESDPKPPADVTLLQAPDGWYAKRIDGWWFVRTPDEPTPAGESGWPWENNNIWPLTEIPVPPSSVSPSGENTTQWEQKGQGDSSTAQGPSEGRTPWDAYVAAYREFQETDPHGAVAHPTAHHMYALEAALQVAGLPLPDSETESCPAGECNLGMCGGTSDHNGPCGGCCGCLGGCLDARPGVTS